MASYVIKRLLWGVFTVWVISVIAFFIYFVLPPTDPAVMLAGKNPTPESIEATRIKHGFDKPVPVQYVRFMTDLVSGNLENATGDNVLSLVKNALPVTFSLAVVAATIWLTVGLTIGITSALKAGSRFDRMSMATAMLLISLPVPWIALMGLWMFTDLLPIFPAGDYVTILEGGIFQWLWHLLLPAITLCIVFAGLYARMSRTNVRQALMADHVNTATAKGLPKRQVFKDHVLRTGLIPVLVLFGMDMGQLMAGALFTESVFGLPGLGKLIFDAIGTQDFYILITAIMIAAAFVMVANLIVDLIQAAIDPRVRLNA